MSTVVHCPHCQQALKVSEENLGRTVRCPKCQQTFAAEAPAEAMGIQEEPARSSWAPSRPERRESPAVHGKLSFQLRVMKDPEKQFRGVLQARLIPEGLRVKVKKEQVLIPIGTPARRSGTKITLDYEGRTIEMVLQGFNIYQKRLAEDLVAFLNGELDELHAEDYSLPWTLYIPVILPLGIPIVTLGGAIPAMVGFGIAAANFGIAQQEQWPLASRLLLMFLLFALGVAGIFALVVALAG